MLTALVRFDKWSWYFFILWFGVALMLWLAKLDVDGLAAHWGIVLILVNNLIRLLFVAEHFRFTRQPGYRSMSYILLFVLLVSITVQLLR
jgi:hypothetical protein